MKIQELTKKITPQKGERLAVALGYFDSVHLGHRRIFAAAKDYARRYDSTKCAAVTFTNNLNDYVKRDMRSVYTYHERLTLLDACGLDYVIPYRFTHTLMQWDADVFLNDLCKRGDIAAFLCGGDYTFGRRSSGNVERLKALCAPRGIDVLVIDDVYMGDRKISSSDIRSYLSAGEIESANAMLSLPFFISGKVVRGRGEGHRFGYPTANLELPPEKILPMPGVYGGEAEISEGIFKAAIHVGEKPTFRDFTSSVEALILGFSGDLYGKTMKLRFFKRLRDIRAFDSPKALGEQIARDIAFSNR